MHVHTIPGNLKSVFRLRQLNACPIRSLAQTLLQVTSSSFGYLKEKLTAFLCTNRDELKSAIITFFNEIARQTLLAVFNSWLERPKWGIKHDGR
jgi:hypothetical protein